MQDDGQRIAQGKGAPDAAQALLSDLAAVKQAMLQVRCGAMERLSTRSLAADAGPT
jgi:hypothetical protein